MPCNFDIVHLRMNSQDIKRTETRSKNGYLTLPEAGTLLQVTPRTILRWEELGKIRLFRFGPRCVRVSGDSLDKMALTARRTGPDLARGEWLAQGRKDSK